MRVWVVDVRHSVDGGFEGTWLFETLEGATAWRRAEGYRPLPWTTVWIGQSVWAKPVYGEWDDLEFVELETADIYEQAVAP